MDIQRECALWDLFYEADHERVDQVLEVFRSRCVRPGRTFTREMFVHVNKVKVIVDKRAEAIPTDFTVTAAQDALLERIKEWMEGPYCEGGRNLWAVLTDWYRLLERHGNLILVLAREGDEVYVTSRSARYAVLIPNETRTAPAAWQFAWTETETAVDPKTGEVREERRAVREWIDAETWIRMVGDEVVGRWDHNLGWIPVVHVAVNVPPGELLGRSVIADLIEPQLHLDAALSMVREVNRWAAWPVFTGATDPTAVDLRPGGYVHDPSQSFRAVTWATSADSIWKEVQQHLQDLYEKGRVLVKAPEVLTEHVTAPSGRALLVLSADGIQYVKTVCNVLEEKMAELLAKVAALAGWIEYDPRARPFQVTYPPLRIEDPDRQLAMGKLLLECYARGIVSKRRVIQALLELDILPFEESPEALENEVAAELHNLWAAMGGSPPSE